MVLEGGGIEFQEKPKIIIPRYFVFGEVHAAKRSGCH